MRSDLPDIYHDDEVVSLVGRALMEDFGRDGDVTSLALVPEGAEGSAQIISRSDCVVSGTMAAMRVFHEVDRALDVSILSPDSCEAGPGSVIMEIRGNSRSILAAERTALNFMQRMTGIATRTARFVSLISHTGCMILDTRKTTPSLRKLEKYAVLCGGGSNHRFGLYDRVLIKDNHRKLWGKGSLGDAVKAARTAYPSLQVEIEVESVEELIDAMRGSPDWVLLDNMDCETMKRCVDIAKGSCMLEASGGIDMDTVVMVADTGVDAISLGCLTHSVKSADLSLEFSEP